MFIGAWNQFHVHLLALQAKPMWRLQKRTQRLVTVTPIDFPSLILNQLTIVSRATTCDIIKDNYYCTISGEDVLGIIITKLHGRDVTVCYCTAKDQGYMLFYLYDKLPRDLQYRHM